jgi:hypothetical protein
MAMASDAHQHLAFLRALRVFVVNLHAFPSPRLGALGNQGKEPRPTSNCHDKNIGNSIENGRAPLYNMAVQLTTIC